MPYFSLIQASGVILFQVEYFQRIPEKPVERWEGLMFHLKAFSQSAAAVLCKQAVADHGSSHVLCLSLSWWGVNIYCQNILL